MADSGRDTKLYPLSDPWHGESGPSFTRKFKPELESGLSKCKDKFATLRDHLRGRDAGGIIPSTPAQIAANPNHHNATNPHPGGVPAGAAAGAGPVAPALSAESMLAFDTRSQECIAQIRAHIPVTSIRLKIDRIEQLAADRDFANGAPVLDWPYPADHPQAGQPLAGIDRTSYQKYGNSLARHVWGRICEDATPNPNSGPNLVAADAAWVTIRLDTLGGGFQRNTISNAKEALDALNRERAAPKTPEESRLKLLTLIQASGANKALHDRAIAEIAYCCDQWRTGGAGGCPRTR